MHVLLVDDDPEIRLGFAAALTRRGHEVRTAGSVQTALAEAALRQPDIGIVDVMLPDGDGFALCREIRARWGFPTVMLTARDEDSDVVGGLEAGADDYVVKPVSPSVLEARLRAVLRRWTAPAEAGSDELERAGELVVDHGASEVRAGDAVLALSATEFRLLAELVAQQGRALSREQLIDRVWRETPPSTPRVVDTTMQRLRAKLADAGVTDPQLETLRGVGYRLR